MIYSSVGWGGGQASFYGVVKIEGQKYKVCGRCGSPAENWRPLHGRVRKARNKGSCGELWCLKTSHRRLVRLEGQLSLFAEFEINRRPFVVDLHLGLTVASLAPSCCALSTEPWSPRNDRMQTTESIHELRNERSRTSMPPHLVMSTALLLPMLTNPGTATT